MPKYAYFDHTATSPAPVTGWYDTDAITYNPPPDAANLLLLTTDQWAARITNLNGWAVQNGTTLISI